MRPKTKGLFGKICPKTKRLLVQVMAELPVRRATGERECGEKVNFLQENLDILKNFNIIISVSTSSTNNCCCQATAQDTAELAAFFKALGNPVRLRIVEQLMGGERCVCELHAESGKDQSTISNHLSVLRHSGVVECEQRGKNVFYRLARPCLAEAIRCLRGGC